MALYSKEFPGLAREVRKDVGGVVSVWPKVNGVNVVVTLATASMLVPGGGNNRTPVPAAVVDLPLNLTPPAEAEYSRVDVTFGPAHCPLYWERLPLEVEWASAEGSGTEVVVYDVVRSPLGLLISLNQLREGRPGLLPVLTRIGQMLVEGTDETALTPQAVAPIYAASARVELQDRFRMAAHEALINRLSVVMDRDRFLRAEKALALAHVYEAIAKDPRGGTDLDSKQAAHWRAAFEEAWKALGPLVVDEDQDGEPDATPRTPTVGLVQTKRG